MHRWVGEDLRFSQKNQGNTYQLQHTGSPLLKPVCLSLDKNDQHLNIY